MVRVLQTLGICALLSAGGIVALTLSRWRQGSAQLDEIRSRPSAVEAFQAGGSRAQERSKERPPLIVQAEAFAQILNPPKGPQMPASLLTRSPRPALPPVRPAAPSASFKLRATSCYPQQPDRSMALIAEAGAPEGGERWVKEGTQVGHFVIQEIRRGGISYRDGDRVREMSVERGSSPPRLVRDLRPGVRQVSAAIEDTQEK